MTAWIRGRRDNDEERERDKGVDGGGKREARLLGKNS